MRLAIWWSVFLLPALMLAMALAVRLAPERWPWLHPLTKPQRAAAGAVLGRALWQHALAWATLGALVMSAVRLAGSGTQRLLSYGMIFLEVIGLGTVLLQAERAAGASAPAPAEAAERACAKVNLLLRVGAKRPDGYHELVSVMQTVGVYDELTVRAHTGGGVELQCDEVSLPADETNLCYKAAVTFFARTGIENDGVSIALHKVLPMQAGLGGGSADAAAVLRCLRRLYAPELPDGELEAMAAELGSDVPFCVRGGTALARGRGEELTALPALPACWFVLVKPAAAFSTGRMYGLIDSLGLCDGSGAGAMPAALERGDLAAVCAAMENTFEKTLPPEGETFALRRRLTELGALGAMLSGSGSAVFGVFRREEEARMACAALRGDYPAVFCGPSRN